MYDFEFGNALIYFDTFIILSNNSHCYPQACVFRVHSIKHYVIDICVYIYYIHICTLYVYMCIYAYTYVYMYIYFPSYFQNSKITFEMMN